MNHTNINIESPKGQMKYYVEYVSSGTSSSNDMNYKNDQLNNKIEFYNRSWRDVNRCMNEWTEVTDFDMLEALSATYYDSFRAGISTLAARFNLDFSKLFGLSLHDSFRVGISLLPAKFSIDKIPSYTGYEYQHLAWSNSPDGSIDFDKANHLGRNYIGTFIDENQEDPLQAEYQWFYLGGTCGDNIINGNYKKRVFNFSSADAIKEIGDIDSKYAQKITFKFDLTDFLNVAEGSILDKNDHLIYAKYLLNIASQVKFRFKNCSLAKTMSSSVSCPVKIRLYTTGQYKSGEDIIENEINILEYDFNTTNSVLNSSQFQEAYSILQYSKDDYLPGDYLYIEVSGLTNSTGQLEISGFKIEEGDVITPFTYSKYDLSQPECGNIYNPCYHVAFMNKLYNIDNSFTTEAENGYDNYVLIGLLKDYMETPSQSYKDYDWFYVQNELYNGENGYPIIKLLYNTSKINVYFPQFSVDTYKSHVKYALNVSVRICGREVELCSKLLDRNDALATNNIKYFSNEEYCEYISVDIIDPWSLVYGDEWEYFRREVCGKDKDNADEELNNTGTMLNISLHPVECVDTEDGRKIYNEITDYVGGQNSINLTDSNKDYLGFHISTNHKEPGEVLTIHPQIYYNRTFGFDLSGFNKYIQQTYQITEFNTKVECVLQDKDNIYGYTVLNVEDIMNASWRPADIVDANGDNILEFTSWSDFKEGLYMHMFLHICTGDDLDSSMLCVSSNRILLTQNLFKYLIKIPNIDDNRIIIDEIPMNIYNINAVNKIQQNIIQVDRPDDYKANIIKPVFFRVQSLSSIIVHPEVTEQICINLDAYKSKVDSFQLQIEGVTFVERGRNNSGVIFSIKGSSLPGSITTGTYYILNQDSELITSGKYTYES